MPNVDQSNHVPWLESKRRSRARRAEAREARGRARSRPSPPRGAIVAVATLTFATGGAFAHDRATSTAAARTAGSSVAALQSRLGIAADGVYGPATRRAVRAYQRRHGLAVDGIAGPMTLKSLGLAGSSSASRPSSGTSTAPNAMLEKIAQCESSGNPAAVSAGGRYRGKYQFSRATWRAYGGVGDPAAAPEAEQDRIAAKLYAARGTSPWPACAR